MNKGAFSISILVLHTAFSLNSLSQTTYPNGVDLCNEEPWELVWSDEFNGVNPDGTGLDLTKWQTYTPKDASSTDNPANYATEGTGSGSRNGDGRASNWLDQNVVVSNGMCQLKLYHQTNTANGITAHYSSGAIETYYSSPFSHGAYEARIKTTITRYAHFTFWLWDANGNSEVDICEAYGDPFWTNRHTANSLHGWSTGHDMPNTLNFPHNTNWDRFVGSFMNVGDWHTYRFEWDDNFARFYLDGNLVRTWGGLDKINVTAHQNWQTCTTQQGTYVPETNYFPNVNSAFNIRLTLDIDRDQTPFQSFFPVNIGETDIDYVRVYQRRSASSCQININGPANICNNNNGETYTYNVTPNNFVNPYWTYNTSLLTLVSQTSTSITVKPKIGAYGNAWVAFTNNDNTCNPGKRQNNTVYQNIAIATNVTPTVLAYSSGLTFYGLTIYFNYFFVEAPQPNTTYSWISASNPIPDLHEFSGSTYVFASLYPAVSYTITATNNCGYNISSGQSLQLGVL